MPCAQRESWNCASSSSAVRRDSSGADAEQAAVEVKVFPHRELAVQGVLLRHDAAQLLGQSRMGGHVDAAHEGPAGRRHHPGREHPGRRGLPGAVRAEQPEDLPGPDVEVELVHGGEVSPAVDLGQLLGMDDGRQVGASAHGDVLSHLQDGSARRDRDLDA